MDNILDTPKDKWTTQDSDELYSINRWGQGYFAINDKGNLTILPEKSTEGPVIDIQEVIEEIKRKKIALPCVVRFHDILRSQVVTINRLFRQIIESAGYRGRYFGVYPIKVNQLREVVEEIIDAGGPYDYGLESGSKPELMAALAYNTNPNSLTIVNGYKDATYLRLALLGNKMGKKIIIVIEKLSELPTLLSLANEMQIEPVIGIRAKLSTKATGKWSDSSGENAKFGLTAPEILNAVKILKDAKKEHCLKLFHFHIGSQIPDIRCIKDAINEGARIYTQLNKLNLKLEYFDVGGGLGVDYDGTKSTSDSSVNYTTSDYIEDIVYILKQICDLEEVDHPHIVSESGRAATAHHSCIITPVFDQINPGYTNYPTDKSVSEHILVMNMRDILAELSSENVQETYNDAIQLKDEAANAFKLGVLSLDEKAKVETFYWQIMNKIVQLKSSLEFIPEELGDLEKEMASQYLCNFSVFQSVPDLWAINQLLPILPILRLNEKPEVLCTIADITCDSDGKIKRFIGPEDDNCTLSVHHLRENEEYYLGFFLTGAYQDVMGDMHNLFGALNEVHIFCDDEDPTDFYIEDHIPGGTASEALTYMQYNPQYLNLTIKRNIEKQVQRGKISPKEGVNLATFFSECLNDYTYLK